MRRLLGLLIATIPLAAPLPAQSITVDLALDDFSDFGGNQRVADLPGPDGRVSLREAITAANNTPGPQTILFAIPRSEWSIFYSDRALIRLDNMLYVSDAGLTVDFASQTAFTGDTNPFGNEVGLQYAGPPASIPSLWLATDDCLVRGLDVGIGNNFGNTIWVTGNRNRVVGCTTNGLTIRGDYGGGAFNVIGGSAPGEGNSFSEDVDVLSDADDNVLIGNQFRWGLRISGDTFWGTCDRNRVGGAAPGERNVLAGKGYYGEEGFPTGTQLEIYHSEDTQVEGNLVGTTPDGMAKHPGASGTGGIAVLAGARRTVLRNNVVSGILMVGSNHYQGVRFGIGISVGETAQDTVILGNQVGMAVDGLTPIPNREGIVIASSPNGVPHGVRIGGDAAEANHVAFNETQGVRVSGAAAGVEVRGNSIHDQGALGLDLFGAGGPGVTANDPLDADAGSNGMQNFPDLSAAHAVRILGAGSHVRISGRLRSAAQQAFVLDFYSNAVADPSGHGEGALHLGSTTVQTDGAGQAWFSVLLPLPASAGVWLSSTATSTDGNTSEFSRCIRLRTPRDLPAR